MNGWSQEQLRSRKIGVLMGGVSAEREVSLMTGQACLEALIKLGYQTMAVDVGWNLPEQLEQAGIDVACIALHGRFGEDGRVQGLLEILQIPYTGSGVMASSICIDKVITKQLLLHHQLPTPEYAFIRPGETAADLLSCCPPLPVVVKPSREGSTIGMSIARDETALRQGIAEAQKHDGNVLVEEYIAGQELTVAVVNGKPLPIIQIVPKSGFYDYAAKYQATDTQYLLPAPLPEKLYRRIQQAAVKAYRLLGCRGAARVDFMCREGEIFCIEVNTIPGMTPTSLLPKAAREAGIDFPELVEMMLVDAGLDK